MGLVRIDKIHISHRTDYTDILTEDREFPQDRPDRSEFTVVKTEFYNDIKSYLAGLDSNPHNIQGLEDIVAYNFKHTETEGGHPGIHPAWPTGQDNFEKSLESRGNEDQIYKSALAYVRTKSREEGIDAALASGSGDSKFCGGLLVPLQAEKGVATQIAAKAGMICLLCVCVSIINLIYLGYIGYPMITIPVGTDDEG